MAAGHYHTDTADTIDFDKVQVVSQYVARLANAGAKDTRPYVFDGDAADPAADVRELQLLIPTFLSKAPAHLLPKMRMKLEGHLQRLDALELELTKRGKLSPAEFRDLQLIASDLIQAQTRPDKTLLGILWDSIFPA